MLTVFPTGIKFPSTFNPLWFVLNSLCNCKYRFNLSRTSTVKMGTQALAKRPFCLSCSKPARTCLCARIKTPLLDNSIAVTILQHSQEKIHPLNSTRIATLGLKNLTVAMVSDVQFEAQFLIHLLKLKFGTDLAASKANRSPFSCQIQSGTSDYEQQSESQAPQITISEAELRTHIDISELGNGCEEKSSFDEILVYSREKNANILGSHIDFSDLGNGHDEKTSFDEIRVSPMVEKANILATNAQEVVVKIPNSSTSSILDLEVDHEPAAIRESNGKGGTVNLQKEPNFDMISAHRTVKEAISNTQVAITNQTNLSKPSFYQIEPAPESDTEPDITATIAKWGFIRSLNHHGIPQPHLEKPDFDELLASQVGKDAILNGFVVKKLQKNQLNGSKEFELHEEFEIVIPPGSALLFPTNESIGIEVVDFDVKHLIVLDGTWAKAKRMYHENPWLKFLPHLKLDPSNMSLYSEVRHQPKAGFLSTIESIVSALKALGDNDHDGLDNLLNVFESMVGDQRRCKDERLNKNLPI